MSRIFTTAACLLTLCGPAALAQTSMSNANTGMSGSSMSATPAGRPSDTGTTAKAPNTDAQQTGMVSPSTSKQNPPNGVSPNTSSNTNAMSPSGSTP